MRMSIIGDEQPCYAPNNNIIASSDSNDKAYIILNLNVIICFVRNVDTRERMVKNSVRYAERHSHGK